MKHYHGKICEKHPSIDGLRYSSCRKCVRCHDNAKQARRITIRRATPAWADPEQIKVIYQKAKAKGKVVDHIIPLNHPKVCGLHVPNNLKAINALPNLEKGNRFRVITCKPKEIK